MKSYSVRLFWDYLTKLDLKNCKISGNFGDLEILTDETVPETVETLVKKASTTETKSAGLDYTAFMVNKETSSKHINKKRTVYGDCSHRIYISSSSPQWRLFFLFHSYYRHWEREPLWKVSLLYSEPFKNDVKITWSPDFPDYPVMLHKIVHFSLKLNL